MTGGDARSRRTGEGRPGTPFDGCVPLVLGVTGHRAIHRDATGAIAVHVARVLDELATRCPHTPLLLVTPLAEGADRIVARIAIEKGARLIVPLPLERADYETDFTTPTSRAEFAELLSHAQTERWFVVPQLATGRVESGSATARDLQYLLVGVYVARYSHLLLALWDGIDSPATGGTAQIVRLRRTGHLDVTDAVYGVLAAAPAPYAYRRAPRNPLETGPVCHIVTPRDAPGAPAVAVETRYLAPKIPDPAPNSTAEYFERTWRLFSRIEDFNARARGASGS